MSSGDSPHRRPETDAHLRGLIDEAPVVMWVTDGAGRCTFLNQGWTEMTGQTEAEGLGAGWLEPVHPDDREEAGRIFREAVARRSSFTLEYRLRRQDGRYGWAIDSGRPRFDEEGRLIGFVGSVFDISERREAEAALRESEAKFRTIAEALPQMVWMADAAGHHHYFNPGFYAFTGVVAGVPEGEGWLELVHPEDRAGAQAQWAQSLASGEDYEAQLRLRHRSGQYRWTLARALPVRDLDGRITQWLGTSTDIDGQKRSELSQRLLAEASEILSRGLNAREAIAQATRHLVPALTEWCTVHLVEPDGRLHIAAAHHADPQKAASGLEFSRRYPPRDVPGGIYQVLRSGQPLLIAHITDAMVVASAQDEEHLRVLRETDMRSYAAIPIQIRGEGVGVIAMVNGGDGRRLDGDDLALGVELARRVAAALDNARLYQRALAEARSRAVAEERLRLITETIPQLTWTTTPEGEVNYVNRRWIEYTGLDLEQTRVAGWPYVVHPDDGGVARESWARSVVTGERYEVQYRMRRHDGTFRWHLARGEPIRGVDGTIEQWFGTCTDIDDQRRLADLLEARVAERTAELTEAYEEMESFSYSVSHDLRAPLRSIAGFSELLLYSHEDSLAPEARGYLLRVQDSAAHMGRLIHDMLTLSRLARQEIHRVEVDISALASRVLAGLREQEPARQVEILVQPGLSAQADPVLLEAVLQNLLGNAWKFTRNAPRPRIEVGAEPGGAFYVRDNGAGFDMAYHDRLFGAFQRLHRSDEFEGTGIGLASVHRIIRRHHGRIWAEGAVDRGATFRFTLAPG